MQRIRYQAARVELALNWSEPKPEVGGLPFDHLVGAGEFVPAALAMWQRRRDSLTSVNKNMVEAIDGRRRKIERLGNYLAP
jgi:hypothetical protein